MSASAYIITAFPVYDMASGSTAVLPLLVLVGRVHIIFQRSLSPYCFFTDSGERCITYVPLPTTLPEKIEFVLVP